MRHLSICLLLYWTSIGLMTADDTPGQSQTAARDGYADCSWGGNHQWVPVSARACEPSSGSVTCGEKLEVLEQDGDWLKVQVSSGFTRYVRALSVSQASDRFVPFDEHSGIPKGTAPDCSLFPVYRVGGDVTAPTTTYSPSPQYTKAARKAKYQGTCVLQLIVGPDGKPHDIKVAKHSDYGLDENAIDAVKQWTFTPAMKAGQAVAVQVNVQVAFRLTK
jgi:TonB family protein